jgi:hypothetical protein
MPSSTTRCPERREVEHRTDATSLEGQLTHRLQPTLVDKRGGWWRPIMAPKPVDVAAVGLPATTDVGYLVGYLGDYLWITGCKQG